MKSKKNKRIFTSPIRNFRTKILGIILLCWMIPLVTMGTINTIIYRTSYQDKIDSSVINELNYAGMLTAEKLETHVGIFYNDNLQKKIGNAYKDYLSESITKKELSTRIRSYMKKQFFADGQYDMTDIIFSDNAEYHYYESSDSLAEWFDYRENVYPVLLKSANENDSKVNVHVNGEDVYLMKKIYISSDNPMAYTTDYAILILKLKKSECFQYLLEDRFWNSDVVFSINGKMGVLSPSTESLITQETLDEIARSPVGTIIRRSEDVVTGGMIRGNRVEFKYAAAVRNDIIYAENDMFLMVSFGVLIALIPILIVLTSYVYNKLDKPITALITGTERIKYGELGTQVEYESDDELGYLMESFNMMSLSLKHMFDRSYREEMALKDAKILALQAQINPHFLNNTLELMNWKARILGDETLSKMIESLSMLLDISMNRENKRTIELAEELEYTDAYLYIIQVRFGDRISVKMDIDDDLLEEQIPPLILQPLVENAVTHGVEPAYRGTIWISAKKADEDFMEISVENDGKELNDEDLEKIKKYLESTKHATVGELAQEKKHMRLGIRNVDERIRLICGEEYGLTVEKLQNGHTLNKIVMPISHKSQK